MSLRRSQHTIVAPISGSDEFVAVNPLWGTADVLSADEVAALQREEGDDLAQRHHLVDPDEEERLFKARYLDFLDARDSDEVQLFYVPGYACNFACDYCYQESYTGGGVNAEPAVVDAFFAYVDGAFAGRRVYLTIFGGEPLLPGPQRRVLERLVDGATARNIDIAVVTNGYHLVDALPVLRRGRVREVQVTLDGPRAVHGRRRPLKGGGSTFDRVVAGIDAALQADLPVNLRVVVDRDNLSDLPALARFALARGWAGHPRLKTQLGRNYELHTCQSAHDRIFTRSELYTAFLELAGAHPELLSLHRPSLHGMKHLADTGDVVDPIYDACPACKTEWAFDHTGRIYPCTANVGRPGRHVGTFSPQVHLDEDAVALWEDRDVLSIGACASCSSRLLCGGGCGEVAFNQSGSVLSPDCRPVADLLGIGAALYFNSKDTP